MAAAGKARWGVRGGSGLPARLHCGPTFPETGTGAASTPPPSPGGDMLSASTYGFHSGHHHTLEWSRRKERISAPGLFSGSLLNGGQHQRSSKSNLEAGLMGRGEPLPAYKPAEPRDEAFIFNTGLREADLYFTSYIDRHDKPRRPGHRSGQMPSAGFAQRSSRGKTPKLHHGQRLGLNQKDLECLSKGCTQVDCRERTRS